LADLAFVVCPASFVPSAAPSRALKHRSVMRRAIVDEAQHAQAGVFVSRYIHLI
jgi:hypothetical protein